VRIFSVGGNIDLFFFAKERGGNAKGEFSVLLRYVERLRLLPLAPAPALPFADERTNFLAAYFRRQKQITLERQEDRRSFSVLRERKHRRADLAMSAEGKEKVLRLVAQSRPTITDEQFAGRISQMDRNLIRAGNRLFVQGPSLSRRTLARISEILPYRKL